MGQKLQKDSAKWLNNLQINQQKDRRNRISIRGNQTKTPITPVNGKDSSKRHFKQILSAAQQLKSIKKIKILETG